MLTAILSFIAGAVAGFLGSFFIWRNNKAKVAKYADAADRYNEYLNEFKGNIKDKFGDK